MIRSSRFALVAFGLAVALAPRLGLAVVVAEPTGDAEPSFLAEMKASLETVAAEAPAEFHAALRLSATQDAAGVSLTVELVPDDGAAPVRETRLVSKASALPQARAMARKAIAALSEPAPSAEANPAVDAVAKSAGAPPAPLPLPEKYSRRKALLMTVLPTAVLLPSGLVLSVLGMTVMDGGLTLVAFPITSVVAVITPSSGYFYIGRWQYAAGMMGLRTVLAVLANVFFVLDFSQSLSREDLNDSEGCTDEAEGCETDPGHGLLILSLATLGAIVTLGVIESALVGRAADRANEQYRKRLTVTFTPTAWRFDNGDRAYGIALQGTF